DKPTRLKIRLLYVGIIPNGCPSVTCTKQGPVLELKQARVLRSAKCMRINQIRIRRPGLSIRRTYANQVTVVVYVVVVLFTVHSPIRGASESHQQFTVGFLYHRWERAVKQGILVDNHVFNLTYAGADLLARLADFQIGKGNFGEIDRAFSLVAGIIGHMQRPVPDNHSGITGISIAR